ncbi:MAG: TonB-dependent receptor [Proteobacteria bacterium]|nr:MAG: TonB-dependent receptor [Pseudomonadota bacterium]
MRRRHFLLRFLCMLLLSVVGTESFGQPEISVEAAPLSSDETKPGPSVTIISKEEIESKNRTTVEELLRDVPGLDVVRSGSVGQTTSIFVRGARSEDTLVLIDGIEVNDPLSPSRGYDFANLAADNIERIEIFRGPQGVRFGANALGGAINVITKKGLKSFEPSARLEAGSYKTVRGSLSTLGTSGNFDYSLGVGHLRTEGFSAADRRQGAIEKDGVDLTTVSSAVGLQISEAARADLTARLITNDVNLDRSGGPDGDDPNYTSKFRQILVGGSSHIDVLRGNLKLGYFFTDLRRESENAPDFDNVDESSDRFSGSSHKAEIAYDHAISALQKIGILLQSKSESGESTGIYSGFASDFNKQKQDVVGAALSYAFDNDVVFADLGYRIDHQSRFGAVTTYRAAIGTRIAETDSTLRVAYGTGFKAPSLYQTYSSFGSTELESEEAEAFELSWLQKLKAFNFEFTAFKNDYTSLIDFNSTTLQYQNIARARTSGLEASLDAALFENFRLSGSYKYLDAKDLSSDLSLLRRARHAWTLTAESQVMQATVRVDYRFRGKRSDIDPVSFARTSLPSFGIFDVIATYPLGAKWAVRARVENLFDLKYQEVAGYGTPGVSAYIGADANF